MNANTRRIVVALLAAFVVVMLIVSMMGTAGAHNELGDIAIEVTEAPDDPSTITIRVRITYSDDGHPVEDGAVVTYAVTPTDGRPAEQGEMPRVGDGQYEVTVTIGSPGDYVIAVNSTDPEGAASVEHTVAAPPVTTTTTTSPDDSRDDPEDSENSDEVLLNWPIVIGGIVFLAAVGGLLVVAVRRRAS